jgi:hypothetical protein
MSKSAIYIDDIPSHILKKKRGPLQNRFRVCVLSCIYIDIFVIALFITFFIVYAETGYYLTLIPKCIQIIRTILLVRVIFMKVTIYWLRGNFSWWGVLLIKHFKKYRPIGLWLLFGYIDLFLFRWTTLIIDIYTFSTSNVLSGNQAISYLLLDILYIIEFHLTFYLLFSMGVINNIQVVISNVYRSTSQE